MNSSIRSKKPLARTCKGFIALITVILLAAGMEAFSLASLSAAYSYSDIVLRRELRIQARLNLLGCLDSARLEMIKGFNSGGQLQFKDLSCFAKAESRPGAYELNATSSFQGIRAVGNMLLNADNFQIISREIF